MLIVYASCVYILNIHSSDNQIHMKEVDISTTTFRTHEGDYEFLVMSFRLYNVPSTFQSFMNHILKPYIWTFVLIFFDNILIYNKYWEAHLQHVSQILKLLQDHHLFVKKSKCYFGLAKVEYLGHIVGCEGVHVDPRNIQSIKYCSCPKTLKSLWGLLGLTWYYLLALGS